MKLSFLFSFLMLLSTNLTLSQISSSDEKKLLKIIGEDFVKNDLKSSYPFGLHPETCVVDTSTTLVGDTTGLIFNNEYVLFRDFIHFKTEKELFSLMKPNVVSVGEYQEFKNYVRDSIARYQLFRYHYWGKERAKMINYGDATVSRISEPSDFNYSLNWDYKFSYGNAEFVPSLSNLYLNGNNSFRNTHVFDERTFHYKYYDFLKSAPKRRDFETKTAFFVACQKQKRLVSNYVSISNNNFNWAHGATHNNDERGILSQLYDKIDAKNPVVGVIGTQAKAFCNWKQQQLQQELNKKKLNYSVVVTLASPDQISEVEKPSKLEIPKYDFTDQWKITKSEFAEFTDYAEDSVKREIYHLALLIDEDAKKFINYRDMYFDWGALEYLDFDQSDREMNREYFSLNKKAKFKRKYIFKEDTSFVNAELSNNNELTFRYSTMRTIAKSWMLCTKCDTLDQFIYTDERFVDPIELTSHYKASKTYVADRNNELGHNSGVRLLSKLYEYIQFNAVSIELPENALNGDPNSIIESLTYEQALAFYNWKYRIDKFDPKKEDWQQFIYPSEEQFNAIQKGESMIIPEHSLDFPTPLFRYVVHVYPK